MQYVAPCCRQPVFSCFIIQFSVTCDIAAHCDSPSCIMVYYAYWRFLCHAHINQCLRVCDLASQCTATVQVLPLLLLPLLLPFMLLRNCYVQIQCYQVPTTTSTEVNSTVLTTVASTSSSSSRRLLLLLLLFRDIKNNSARIGHNHSALSTSQKMQSFSTCCTRSATSYFIIQSSVTYAVTPNYGSPSCPMAYDAYDCFLFHAHISQRLLVCDWCILVHGVITSYHLLIVWYVLLLLLLLLLF